jgi:hypothetical protein
VGKVFARVLLKTFQDVRQNLRSLSGGAGDKQIIETFDQASVVFIDFFDAHRKIAAPFNGLH